MCNTKVTQFFKKKLLLGLPLAFSIHNLKHEENKFQGKIREDLKYLNWGCFTLSRCLHMLVKCLALSSVVLRVFNTYSNPKTIRGCLAK